MDYKEFSLSRQRLQKTQKQMGELLGISLRTVQSFEQGWRKVPVHIERQMLFLLSAKQGISGKMRPCWEIHRNCTPERREACPAWEFKVGICWFINGTICKGKVQQSWAKKMKLCRTCEVFVQTMKI